MKEAHKQRLVGATILVAVAILFLPSFLKDEREYALNTQSQIPARPSITAVDFGEAEAGAEMEPAPAPEAMFNPDDSHSLPPAPATPLDQTSLPPAPEAISAASSSVSSSSASSAVQAAVVADTLAPLPAPLTAPAVTSAGLVTGFAVRVASLSSREAATRLESRLQAQGYKAYVRTGVIPAGSVYRVFVGPFIDQTEATRAKRAIDAELKVTALVQKFEP